MPGVDSVLTIDGERRLPATVPAAIAATTAVTAATTAATAGWPRAGFVHVKCSTIKLCSVQAINGGLTFATIWHFYEAETTRASGLSVHDDVYCVNVAVLGETCFERFFRGVETEVPDVDIQLTALRSLCGHSICTIRVQFRISAPANLKKLSI